MTIGRGERNTLQRHKVISGSKGDTSLRKGCGKVKDQTIGMLQQGDISEYVNG